MSAFVATFYAWLCSVLRHLKDRRARQVASAILERFDATLEDFSTNSQAFNGVSEKGVSMRLTVQTDKEDLIWTATFRGGRPRVMTQLADHLQKCGREDVRVVRLIELGEIKIWFKAPLQPSIFLGRR